MKFFIKLSILIYTALSIPSVLLAAPDYASSLYIKQKSLTKDVETMDMIVNISELENSNNTQGKVSFSLTKNSHMVVDFDPIEISRLDETVNNMQWSMQETLTSYIFTFDANDGNFPGASSSKIGLSATYYAPHYAKGFFTLYVSLHEGSGDGNAANDQNSETISYTNMADITPPVITLNGVNSITLTQGETYTELGATAIDYWDNVTVPVTISGTVNTNVVGTYTITYTAQDASGHQSTATRTVHVIAAAVNHPPEIVTVDSTPLPQNNTYSTSVLEGQTKTFAIESSDTDGDNLTYSISNKPSFMQISTTSNGVAQITLAPQSNDAGSYPNIQITVSDGNLSDTMTLNVTVEQPTQDNCDYYADPVNGSMSNNGSLAHPWKRLQDILGNNTSFADNKTLCLLNGNHGMVYMNNYHFATNFTIKEKEGHTPYVEKLSINNSDHITFKKLTVDGSITPPANSITNRAFLLNSAADSHHLNFVDLIVKSSDNSSTWTKDDWYDHAYSGAWFRGDYVSVTNALFLNTYHAVIMGGNHALLAHSVIDNFAGDAIRGLGSFSTYEYNTVRDCYIDDYAIQHDDGFQAYNLGDDGKIEGVIIRFNKFLLFADPITSFIENNNLVGTLMQGLILTDGYADNWTIENNLIVNAQSHGISLYGGRHSRIQNNTVMQHPHYYSTNTGEIPRVYVDKNGKNNKENFDNIIRNNIAAIFTTWTFDATSTVENNTQLNRNDLSSYTNCFVDYNGGDFHLKTTSVAKDAGVNTDVTSTDLDGNSRVVGASVDTGSYEVQ